MLLPKNLKFENGFAQILITASNKIGLRIRRDFGDASIYLSLEEWSQLKKEVDEFFEIEKIIYEAGGIHIDQETGEQTLINDL